MEIYLIALWLIKPKDAGSLSNKPISDAFDELVNAWTA
jgi:hypothetical protein